MRYLMVCSCVASSGFHNDWDGRPHWNEMHLWHRRDIFIYETDGFAFFLLRMAEMLRFSFDLLNCAFSKTSVQLKIINVFAVSLMCGSVTPRVEVDVTFKGST